MLALQQQLTAHFTSQFAETAIRPNSYKRRRLPARSPSCPFRPINRGTDKPPCDKTPLVRLNPVQSKLLSFYRECRDRERQINSSRCSLCTLRRTKSPVMYILQINKNTKHKLRHLYCYVLFPVGRLLTTHKVTVYDIFLSCVGILNKYGH